MPSQHVWWLTGNIQPSQPVLLKSPIEIRASLFSRLPSAFTTFPGFYLNIPKSAYCSEIFESYMSATFLQGARAWQQMGSICHSIPGKVVMSILQAALLQLSVRRHSAAPADLEDRPYKSWLMSPVSNVADILSVKADLNTLDWRCD